MLNTALDSMMMFHSILNNAFPSLRFYRYSVLLSAFYNNYCHDQYYYFLITAFNTDYDYKFKLPGSEASCTGYWYLGMSACLMKSESVLSVCNTPDYLQQVYSGTSDSQPSEIGTVYNSPLYEGHCLRSQIFTFPIVSSVSYREWGT